MNRFACVALAVLGTGALVLASTPLDAKGGGGGGGVSMRGMARASFRPAPRPNIGPLSQRGYPVARNIGPLSGRYLASRHGGHHHGHGHGHGHYGPHYGYGYLAYGAYGYSDYGLSDYGYSDYGYSAYGLPSEVADEVLRPAPHKVEPVIRTVENSKNVCASESVKVPGSNGGEATVTILRC
jgi:hypothetical protein